MILTRLGSTLLFDGVPRRTLGIDMYRSCQDWIETSATTYQTEMSVASSAGFKLTRSLILPMYASDWTAIYNSGSDTVSAAYLTKLGVWLDALDAVGMGAICVFFWRLATLSDFRHGAKSVSDWAASGGLTRTTMRNVVRDIVATYKDHPAVAAWELGNEWGYITRNRDANAYVVNVPKGTKASYDPTGVDLLSTADFLNVMADFATAVRANDPSGRLILNGTGSAFSGSAADGYAGGTCGYLRGTVTQDARDCTGLAVHCYSTHVYSSPGYVNLTKRLADLHAVSLRVRKPLILEEFGVGENGASTFCENGDVAGSFTTAISAVENSPVQAALLWSYSDTNPSWRITPDNDRSYMWVAASAANRRMWEQTFAPRGLAVMRGMSDGRKFCRQTSSSNGNYLSLADNESLRPAGAFSVSLWVRKWKEIGPTFSRLIAKRATGDTVAGWHLLFDNSADRRLSFAMLTAAGTDRNQQTGGPMKLLPRLWHHIAVVFDPTLGEEMKARRMMLYINGEPLGGGGSEKWLSTDIFTHSTQPLTIFSSPNGFSVGEVDVAEVRFWGRALPDSEVFAMSHGASPRTRDFLIAEWLFDGEYNDTSGNGNHLTVNGTGPQLMTDPISRRMRNA